MFGIIITICVMIIIVQAPPELPKRRLYDVELMCWKIHGAPVECSSFRLDRFGRRNVHVCSFHGPQISFVSPLPPGFSGQFSKYKRFPDHRRRNLKAFEEHI